MSQAWHITIHFCTGTFGALDEYQADARRLFDDYSVFGLEFAGDARAKTEPPRCSKTAVASGDHAQGKKLSGVEQSFKSEEVFFCAVGDHDNSLMIRNIGVSI